MEHYEYVSVDKSDYLMHYGIKGMKWGVRRTPQQLGHAVSSGRQTVSRYMSKSLSSIGESYGVYKKNRTAKKTASRRQKSLKKARRTQKRAAKEAKKQAKTEAKYRKMEEKTRRLNTETAYKQAKINNTNTKRARRAQFLGGSSNGQNGGNKQPGAVRSGIRQGIQIGLKESVSKQIVNALTSEKKDSGPSKEGQELDKQWRDFQNNKTASDMIKTSDAYVRHYSGTSTSSLSGYLPDTRKWNT